MKTTEEFIEKAKKIHGDKYNYSKTVYTGRHEKLVITCPIHGDFEQLAGNHLRGAGCYKCGRKKCSDKMFSDTDSFVEKAKKIHGDRYDYSKVNYINSRTPVCIICPDHGEYWQTPNNHLTGYGCKECGKIAIKNKVSHNTEWFITEAKKIHGNKYDYSKTVYNSFKKQVTIICPIHGEFKQYPQNHLRGWGCNACGNIQIGLSQRKTTEDFINKAQEIHNGKYDYSDVVYITSKIPVKIICPDHGLFWQTPNAHLRGEGCPFCVNYKLEEEIKSFLTNQGINFECHKTFPWLKFINSMHLDFYLPDYNTAIECQGIQHFIMVEQFGEESFIAGRKRDEQKALLCRQNGVNLLYYTSKENFEHAPMENRNNLFTDKNKLLEKMVKNMKENN